MNNSPSVLLAEKRTALAAVRTLLAFVRTGLVCVSVALAFVKLDKEHPVDGTTVTLFVVGALFMLGGVIQYFVAVANARKIVRSSDE